MKLLIRALVCICLITILLIYVDPRSVLASLLSIDLRYLIIVAAIWLTNQFLLTLRWQILLKPLGFNLKYYALFMSTISGHFIGMVVPGGYGIDVGRYWDLRKHSSQNVKPALSLLMDRILGLSGCVFLGMVMIIPAYSYVQNKTIVVAICGFVSFVTVVLFTIFNDRFIGFVSIFNYNTIFSKLIFKVSEVMFSYKSHMRIVIKAFCLSIMIRILMIFGIYVFSISLGWELNPIYFFIFIPIVLILLTIPVSVQNLGTRDLLYIYFFSQVGIAPQHSLALSVAIFSWEIFASLLCGIVFLFVKRKYQVVDTV